jgi:hypothetical protein
VRSRDGGRFGGLLGLAHMAFDAVGEESVVRKGGFSFGLPTVFPRIMVKVGLHE